MTQLFWFCLALLGYIYVGYPLLLGLLGIGRRAMPQEVDSLPSVSVLIAAYNEARDIEATLRNKLALDYPHDRLEIIVVSDESTDGTDAIVEKLAAAADIPVRLVRQQPRRGKTAGLNLIVPRACGEILVFSDANSMYEVQALRHLVACFADPAVGYVTGKMVYTNPEGALLGDGCSSYMKYENRLRELETRLGSVVGVDGGIDAMRRSLYTPLAADQLPDFVQPLKVVEQGCRVVYTPGALLMEAALDSAGSEYPMRVRVALRALWALHDMRALLNPFRYGLFSLQLFSHKVLRYLAFIPLLLVFILNILLLPAGPVYPVLLCGQLLFYLLAWLGYHAEGRGKNPRYLALPYYFTLLNLASLHAVWRYLKGEKQVIWKPREG
jgi:cellulose synthase/poly-beta-1,6-N-acetylglucosamine synthase-like glycosyltransferase